MKLFIGFRVLIFGGQYQRAVYKYQVLKEREETSIYAEKRARKLVKNRLKYKYTNKLYFITTGLSLLLPLQAMSELTRNYFDNKYFREELSNKLAQQKAAAANDSNYSFDVLSERTSYTNEKSELHDNVNDQLALRSQIIKNPDFFKQLSLSFYGKKDRSADPSPRLVLTSLQLRISFCMLLETEQLMSALSRE